MRTVIVGLIGAGASMLIDQDKSWWILALFMGGYAYGLIDAR